MRPYTQLQNESDPFAVPVQLRASVREAQFLSLLSDWYARMELPLPEVQEIPPGDPLEAAFFGVATMKPL